MGKRLLFCSTTRPDPMESLLATLQANNPAQCARSLKSNKVQEDLAVNALGVIGENVDTVSTMLLLAHIAEHQMSVEPSLYHAKCETVFKTASPMAVAAMLEFGESLGVMVRRYGELCVVGNLATQGVNTLLYFMLSLDTSLRARNAAMLMNGDISTGLLTPVHTQLALLAAKSKTFSTLLPLLDVDIVGVAKETGALPEDMLLYFYYAAHCYAALKNFKRALEVLTLIYVVPSEAVSRIAVEAYKRFVLLSLLVHGRVVALPKFTIPSLTRHTKAFCAEYVDFGQAFESLSPVALNAVIGRSGAVFEADRLFGLVKQCKDALQQRAVLRLTHTFITVSLAEIARELALESPAAAEAVVLRLIDSGQIHARIDLEGAMVAFTSDAERYDSPATVLKLRGMIERCMALTQRISAVDAEISASKPYLLRTDFEAQYNALGAGGSGDAVENDESMHM
eukprot:Amastigsp_a341968_49.p1 type:complete len:454 gc:universal Amastigsp_a341968_49:1-1362(+)